MEKNAPASLLARLTAFFLAEDEQGETHCIAGWAFMRLLGAVYLAAFAALWPQILGLIGKDGISPAVDFLAAVQRQVGPDRFWLVPTLGWLGAGDGALRLWCGIGTALSAVVMLGLGWAPLLLALYVLYLSIVWVGGDFLSFQWDILLLETGFVAIFLAPLWPRLRPVAPSPAILFLLRLLLFRLMFASGMVKLTSGDATWRDLSALHYHFETQPLPTWVGYYLHQLPEWMKMLSTGLMFGIELVVPIFIFFPSRVRRYAFFPLVLLQALIALSGNYGFFNWLTLALCVTLLPDSWLRRLVPARFRPWSEGSAAPNWARRAQGVVCAMLFLVWVPLGLCRSAASLLRGTDRDWVPPRAQRMLSKLAPFHVLNSYGLFAVMTTTRSEILIEGSQDGTNWSPYEFKYKPQDLWRRPGFIAPYQPRLDWQMWFAALSSERNNPWFSRLCLGLLQGRSQVLSLLGKNPFLQAPPRYLRAVLYDYHFTTLAEKRRTGDWWKRSEQGMYLPVVSLRGDE